MPIDDIRKRYQAPPSNLAEEVKRLRAENTQQKNDILQLLAEVDRLQGGQPPGPPVVPGAEDAAINQELKDAGLSDFKPSPQAPPREAENVAGNLAAGRSREAFQTGASERFQTARGLPITANAFDEDYTGPR